MRKIIVAICVLMSISARSQTDTVAAADTITFRPGSFQLSPIPIFSWGNLSNEELSKFRGMLFRINKVYPYAAKALNLMEETDRELAAMSKKRDQRRYRKMKEKQLREQYKTTLKQFTRGETVVMIKILERATSSTLHQIIKKYKDGLTAGWWQSVGKLAGVSLKEGYDSEQWPYMEIILSAMEEGVTIPTQ